MKTIKNHRLFLIVFFCLLFVTNNNAQWWQNTIIIGGVTSGANNLHDNEFKDAYINTIINFDKRAASDIIDLKTRLDILGSIKLIYVYDEYRAMPVPSFGWSPDRTFNNDDSNADPNYDIFGSGKNGYMFLNYGITGGCMLWDEPEFVNNATRTNQFSAIKKFTTKIRSINADKIPLVNLFPIYYESYPYNIDEYKSYINSYLELFNSETAPAPALCFDFYKFKGPGGNINKGYYTNLRIFSEKAQEFSRLNYKIPFYAIIQLTKDNSTNNYRYVTEAELRWEVYTALAYGAKGFFYYTLYKSMGTMEGVFSHPDSIAFYNSIKNLNTEVHNLTPILKDLEPVIVYHCPTTDATDPIDDPLITDTNKVYNIVQSIMEGSVQSSSALVGYLKRRSDKSDYLFVVNRDVSQQRTFTIKISGSQSSTILKKISKTNGGEVNYSLTSAGTFDVTLAPGSGELFKLEDDIEEYIPNVNVVKKLGARTYYAHRKGVVMVDNDRGYRTYFNDWNTYSNVQDLQFNPADNSILIVQKFDFMGNGVRLDCNLMNSVIIRRGDSVLPHVTPVSACVATAGKLFLGQNYPNYGRLLIYNNIAPYNKIDSLFEGCQINELLHDPVRNAIFIAHSTGIKKLNANSINDTISWDDWGAKSPFVCEAKDENYLYAGIDAGYWGGNLQKLSLTNLSNVGVWQYGNVSRRILDVEKIPGQEKIAVLVAAADGNRVVVLQTSDFGLQYNFLVPDATKVFSIESSAILVATAKSVRKIQLNTIPLNKNHLESEAQDVTHKKYELVVEDCFPNPFNPEAKVRYKLNYGGKVKYTVVNSIGQVIEPERESFQEAGTHTIKFSGANYPSGIYFVKITFGSESIVKKLVLLK